MSGFDWDLGQETSNLAWYRKYRPRNLDDYAGESVCQKVRAVMRPENRSHLPHLWFIYGTAFELLALPFLFAEGNVLNAIIVVGGTIAISIALPIVYSLVILRKFSEQ